MELTFKKTSGRGAIANNLKPRKVDIITGFVTVLSNPELEPSDFTYCTYFRLHILQTV